MMESLQVARYVRSSELNAHVQASMISAERCVKWLVSQGFTVLNVTSGRRNPRIEIEPCPLCLRLEGVIYMTERQYNQPTRSYRVARRFDCEVRWTERGQS